MALIAPRREGLAAGGRTLTPRIYCNLTSYTVTNREGVRDSQSICGDLIVRRTKKKKKKLLEVANAPWPHRVTTCVGNRVDNPRETSTRITVSVNKIIKYTKITISYACMQILLSVTLGVCTASRFHDV